MKAVMKDIEMICYFSYDKEKGKVDVHPIRFRMTENEEYQTVKVGKVITKTQQRFQGAIIWIFDCQSVIQGIEKRYQLIYYTKDCKWILAKI